MSEKVCSLCGDRGIILQGEAAVPCSCVQKNALSQIAKNFSLPPKLRDCSLEGFNYKYYPKDCLDMERGVTYFELAKMARQAAEGFVNSFLKDPNTDGLMYTGQVGSGKTFLVSGIANALLKQGKPVLVVVVPDLLDQIRATYGASGDSWEYTEFELLDSARRVPLLVLDDLGINNYSEWSKNKIYSIINYRLNNRLPVIVTTNITPEDLEEYLGERTTSRLLEMCQPYRLQVDVDIRAKRRRERG
jgi:DNA replication protein DnaC